MDTEHCGEGAPTINWNPTVAQGKEWSYEAVLIHELGHAMLQAPDINLDPTLLVCPNTGVMCERIDQGLAARHLHLYPIDQETTRLVYPVPSGSPVEGALVTVGAYDPYWGIWGTVNRTLGGSSSMGPGLGRTTDLSHRPSVEILRSTDAFNAVLENRDYNSIHTTRAFPGAASVALWPRVATSIYGEFFATWLLCGGINAPCRVSVAYTDQPNVSTSWIGGQLTDTNSYAPADVAYDQQRDRFVMFFLDAATALPRSAHTPAYRPSFSLSTPVLATATAWTNRLRYMGGVAMDTNTVPEDGQLAAATTFGTAPRRVAIGRMYVAYDSGGSRYTAAQPVAAYSGTLFDTPRHFGQARIASYHDLFMVWLRGDGTRSLASSLSNGPGVDFLSATNLPLPGGVTAVTSGTTTAVDYDNMYDGIFAVGFSSY